VRAWAFLLLLAAPAAFAQEVLIDFDERLAPDCAFGGAERVGDQWLAEGVRFLPPPSGPAGAIVEQTCLDRVSGHSPPNIVGWVAGLAGTPLLMEFTDPVESVSIRATNWNRVATLELIAYDAGGGEIGRDSIDTLGMTGPLQDLLVTGDGIVMAELTTTDDDIAVDDLRFLPEVVLPPEFTLYESIAPVDLVNPMRAVAMSPAGPIDYTPSAGTLFFYQVDDGAGRPDLIRIEKLGLDIRVSF
jgi:hypothetical protein